jgi:hypothetical protein
VSLENGGFEVENGILGLDCDCYLSVVKFLDSLNHWMMLESNEKQSHSLKNGQIEQYLSTK